MNLNHWYQADDPFFIYSTDLANIGAVGRRALSICVAPEGICMNGEYGYNPSDEEMREMVEVMRACVAEWDSKYGGKK